MKFLSEKILNAENKNSLWLNGGPASSFKILDNGKYEFTDFQAFAAASVQNPLFFSNNIEYAAQYATEPDSMVGLVRVKELQNLNLLDLTNPEEMAALFPECADSPLFAELFQKGELYYTFNWGKIVHGRETLRPAEFLIARLLIMFRILGKQKFIENFKVYKDKPELYTGSARMARKKETAAITRHYPTVTPSEISKCGLDKIIMDETIDDNSLYSGNITQNEYLELYNAYCEAAFKPCIKKDSHGQLLKDEHGAYILTRYKDLFTPAANENPDRPSSNDPTIGLGLSSGKMSQKALSWDMPPRLSDERLRIVDLYMKLTRQMREWYRRAAKTQNTTLSKMFAKISEIVGNDNSIRGKNKKNVKDDNFRFGPGNAASFIDNLQYMFYYIIQQHANKYDGCWAPETIGMAYRNLKSVDKTILLWNADKIEIIDCVEGGRIQQLINAMRAGELGDDSDFTGRAFDDDSLKRLFDRAKTMPMPEKPVDNKDKKRKSAAKSKRKTYQKKQPPISEYMPHVAKIIHAEDISHREKFDLLDEYYHQLQTSLFQHRKNKSYKEGNMREKALLVAISACSEHKTLEQQWIIAKRLHNKLQKITTFQPGISGQQSIMNRRIKSATNTISLLSSTILKLEKNPYTTISKDDFIAIRNEIASLEKILNEIAAEKNAQFEEFDAVSKYRMQLAEIKKLKKSPEEIFAELIRLRDSVKQQKAAAKNVYHDEQQVQKIKDFTKNELKPELARIQLILKQKSFEQKSDAFSQEFEQIMQSSESNLEKYKRLLDLRSRVQKRESYYSSKTGTSLENPTKLAELLDLHKNLINPTLKKIAKIIKQEQGLTEDTDNKKIRLFDCPMFKIDAVKKYDDITGSDQIAYLLDDDEYVLAVIRDRDSDMYLMASQYRFGAGRNMLEFVGGGKNQDETPVQAIIREINEETKLNPDPSDIVMLSETTMNPSVSESKLYLFYIEVDCDISLKENDYHEHVDLHWMTYEQVSDFIKNGDVSTPSKLLWTEFNNKINPDPGYDIEGQNTGNIIFCDCDGVLIRNDVNNLEDPEEYYYDDKMMDQLIRFAYETNAKVVITSKWRETPDDGTEIYFGIEWPNPLPAIRTTLGDIYIGDAPCGLNKSAAIKKWIIDNGFSGNFVIFDDEPDDFIKSGLENKLILTNPIDGLTRKDTDKALSVLLF